MKLFPDLPEKLESLSDIELSDLAAELRDGVKRVEAADPEFIGEGDTLVPRGELIKAATAAVAGIEQIKAEQAARAEEDVAYQDEMAALAARAEVVAESDDDEPDEDKDETEVTETEVTVETDDVTVETEKTEKVEKVEVGDQVVAEVVAEAEAATAETAEVEEAVVADAAPAKRVYRDRPPLPRKTNRVREVEPEPGALLASSGIEGFSEGQALDRLMLAEALMAKRRRIVSTPKGVREEVVIASAEIPYDEDRRLIHGDFDGNQRKISSVLYQPDFETVLASGGICAPPTPFYDFITLATAARPVKDSLPAFFAERGGILFAESSTITDVDTAISYITADEDAEGGSAATKSCQTVPCPPLTTVEVAIIAKCLQFGNLQGRTWPEQVAHWVDLTAAAHARVAETALLDGIDAQSTQVADEAKYGAVSTVLQGILKAAAAFRSRHRMSPTARFTALFPAHARDLLVADLRHQQFGRFEYSVDGVEGLLRSHGIDPSWYLDEDTGAGMIYGTQAGGALAEFKTTLKWFLFPPGTFLFLDGGSLDLGLVRDSVLNSTNDYQLFAETFENVARLGPESLAITTTLCPDGTVAAPAEAFTC